MIRTHFKKLFGFRLWTEQKISNALLGYSLIFLFFGTYSIVAQDIQSNSGLKELHFDSAPAPEWTALMERSSGWFGADGIFSIPLDGKENQLDSLKNTLFIFSDTFIGEVYNNVPSADMVMVNNSIAWFDGLNPRKTQIQFEFNTDSNDRPISYFIPSNVNALPNEYYWLGDGFVNHKKNGALYLFAYHVHKTGENVFDFEQTNIALLKIEDISSAGIKNYTQLGTNLGFIHPSEGRVYFGSGVFVNTIEANAPSPDGFIYIYGIMERQKGLVVARVKPVDFENLKAWRYWNGEQWSSNKEEVAILLKGVSNELSLTPAEDGRFLLTCTILGLSDKIGISVADTPIGPFGPLNEVYTCPEYAEKGLFTYNAKAHYHLSKPGELLISYNTITFDFWNDIKKDASIYHPRFVKVRYY